MDCLACITLSLQRMRLVLDGFLSVGSMASFKSSMQNISSEMRFSENRMLGAMYEYPETKILHIYYTKNKGLFPSVVRKEVRCGKRGDYGML